MVGVETEKGGGVGKQVLLVTWLHALLDVYLHST